MSLPTVGRIVHYHRPFMVRGGIALDHGEPMAAVVCAVNHEGNLNIAFFDRWGTNMAERNVHFVQEGEAAPDTGIGYCCWPPKA